MSEELQPVAWMYSNKRREEVFAQPNRANMDPRYWREEPLYTFKQLQGFNRLDNHPLTSNQFVYHKTGNVRDKLRSAAEVWWTAWKAWDDSPTCADDEAIAIIEADRQAVRAEQAAEVERLEKLIEATSAHFLRLNTDHPIMWDGAIDAAMEAVCLEVERQAAELAKFKALAETLAGALETAASCLSQCAEGLATQNDMETWAEDVAEALRQYKKARDAS